MTTTTSTRLESGGVKVTGDIGARGAEILTPEALAFIEELHTKFDARRRELLAARVERQKKFDAGELPDFLPETKSIRDGNWKIRDTPADLQDRRVEITGPTDRKMIINALNSGAKLFMADLEDATSPTFANIIEGQVNLKDRWAGKIDFTDPGNGKDYKLGAKVATLLVRPRGWHLPESNIEIGGKEASGSLVDFGLYVFHNAKAQMAKGATPAFYLPKLESHLEARLWDEVFTFAEQKLALPHGTLKATILIETLPAAFEMDEILHALRDRVVGLNCGRWDYIFSCIKTLRAHRGRVLPERGQVTMAQPFLKAYSELLIHTCHRRGAHAMGGMAAQVPISGDAEANDAAMAKVRADKQREVAAGHDGTWVAHPALIPIARAAFDAHMPGANQHENLRADVAASRDDLLRMPLGTITRKGFENNVEVCVRYLAAWLDGNGCVPIHHLMEDAATAEIARAQLWQWLHHEGLHLDDGTPLDFALFERALLNLPSRLAGEALPGAARVREAIGVLDRLTHADTLAEFLTLPAYERID